MATVEQCRQALAQVIGRVAANPDAARRMDLDRSFACHIKDLDTWFRGRLTDGAIVGLTEGADPQAQIRLAVASDDLLALVAGELSFARAWASGRISVHASFRDLLKLRKLA